MSGFVSRFNTYSSEVQLAGDSYTEASEKNRTRFLDEAQVGAAAANVRSGTGKTSYPYPPVTTIRLVYVPNNLVSYRPGFLRDGFFCIFSVIYCFAQFFLL